MPKSPEQFKPYNEQDAFDEGLKMQEKIKAGQAKDYSEAEKIIEEENKQIKNWESTVLESVLSGNKIIITPEIPKLYSRHISSERLYKFFKGVGGRPDLYKKSGSGNIDGTICKYATIFIVTPKVEKETIIDEKKFEHYRYGLQLESRNLEEIEKIIQLLKSNGIEIKISNEIKEKFKPKGWTIETRDFYGYKKFGLPETVMNEKDALRGLHVFEETFGNGRSMIAYFFPENNNEKPILLQEWFYYEDEDKDKEEEYPGSEENVKKLLSKEKIEIAIKNENPKSKANRMLDSYIKKAIDLSADEYKNICASINNLDQRILALQDGMEEGFDLTKEFLTLFNNAIEDKDEINKEEVSFYTNVIINAVEDFKKFGKKFPADLVVNIAAKTKKNQIPELLFYAYSAGVNIPIEKVESGIKECPNARVKGIFLVALHKNGFKKVLPSDIIKTSDQIEDQAKKEETELEKKYNKKAKDRKIDLEDGSRYWVRNEEYEQTYLLNEAAKAGIEIPNDYYEKICSKFISPDDAVEHLLGGIKSGIKISRWIIKEYINKVEDPTKKKELETKYTRVIFAGFVE